MSSKPRRLGGTQLYTLGDLLRDLESTRQRWRADSERMPGIGRIKLACYRLYGTDVTAESVRRLLARICDRYCGIELRVFEQIDLNVAASILENPHDGVPRVPDEDVLTCVSLGGRDWVKVTGLSCKVIAGTKPEACPNAKPPVPHWVLPSIDRAIRRYRQLPAGTTVHWVGHEAGYRQLCRCPVYATSPYASPRDQSQWADVVTDAPAEAKPGPTWCRTSKQLKWKDGVCKRYGNGRPADTQWTVLDAFQNAGWPSVIPDPFEDGRPLKDVIRELNKNLTRIVFAGDGEGKGIQWSVR